MTPNHLRLLSRIGLALLAVHSVAPTLHAQNPTYTYFVRQIQMPAANAWDVNLTQRGTQLSPLAVNPHGARFELWTVRSNPLTSFLLDTTYVNSYVPVAEVTIRSEDPYTVMPRTRVDRPFWVDIRVSGMSSDPTAPEAARTVQLLRHVQAYGPGVTGANVDREAAILLSEGSLSSNGLTTLSYALSAVPGADRSRIRGEERFSVFSLEDYQAPESQLASKFIQIWPMAEGTIHNLAADTVIKGLAPTLTVSVSNIYPDSFTYAQVYPGNPALGTPGTKIPGAAYSYDSAEPADVELLVKDWDESIPEDGTWTLEVITVTPFGTERLAYRTFQVDRTVRINGNVTTVD